MRYSAILGLLLFTGCAAKVHKVAQIETSRPECPVSAKVHDCFSYSDGTTKCGVTLTYTCISPVKP